MVSKRNFFSIIILLLIMIFMFMFSGVLKQELNDYGVNSYVEPKEEITRMRIEQVTVEEELEKTAKAGFTLDFNERDKRVLYLGRDYESDIAHTVKAWCSYSKRPIAHYTTLKGLDENVLALLPKIIVVDGEEVNWENEIKVLGSLVRDGSCVVFARMPSPDMIKANSYLRRVMGIKDIYSESIAIDGVRLFPGFFIGQEEAYKAEEGEEYRQDLNLKIPWYVTGEGTKTYMMGMVDDRTRKSEYLPALVWRHTFGKGKVFCINGDYISNCTGIGFLTACLADRDLYDIYPVINAQNLVLASYGGFSDENGEILNGIYDQRQIALFRDVVWPALVTMEEKTGTKMSLMASPQLDYEDENEPKEGMLIYYLRLLNEGYGEAGISTKQVSSIPLEEKLGMDRVYWDSEALGYKLQSAYLETTDQFAVVKKFLPDLRTVVVPLEDEVPVSYLDETVTRQMTTSYALTHTFSQDLELKAYETALGYSNVVLDLAKISFPESEDWSDYSRKTSSNLTTYWKQFSGFENTTLSESDARIRRFFALDYSDKMKDNAISLHVDHFHGNAYFILKLNKGEIDQIKGAQAVDLKNGFFLLSIEQEDVEITLKNHKLFIN